VTLIEFAATVRLTERQTAEAPALIPDCAVNSGLEAFGAECPVEGQPLVAGHFGLRVGVAVDDVLRFLGAHISGDEHTAGLILLPAREQESTGVDLDLEKFEMGGTGLLDDVGRLHVRRLQDVEHLGDVS